MPVLGKEKTYILQLQNIDHSDAALVGDIGLHYAKLESLNIKTPPAFVITTLAFDDFLTASNIVDDVLVSLAKVVIGDWNSSVQASEEISDMLLGVDFPSLFLNPLLHALNSLMAGRSGYVRLMPSWVLGNNDYNTTLNLDKYIQNFLASEEQILVGIKQCWASLFSPEAIYERAQARYSGALSLALVLQKVLPAEVSGTVFSKDPLTHSNFNLVKAIYGVSATNGYMEDVTQPDLYRVDPIDHRITEKSFAAQTQMRLLKGRVADDPLLVVPVTTHWQSRQKLDDRHVVELSQLVSKLTQEFENDVELDFAVQGGKLFITGVREVVAFSTEQVTSPQVVSEASAVPAVERPKTETIDFNKLVAEVDTLAAEVKATIALKPETIGSESIEKLPLRLPQTVSRIYLDISRGEQELIQYAQEFSSVKIKMESLLKLAGVKQFSSLATEEESSRVISSLSSEIGIAAKISPQGSVLVDLSGAELSDHLASSYLSHPNWLSLEYIAIKKAHREFDLGRFELVLPMVRSYAQLIELRKVLGLNGFRRSNIRLLGLNTALPVNEYLLGQIEEGDIDFVYLPLSQISMALFGHEQLGVEDYLLLAQRVAHLASLARHKKLQVYIDLGSHAAALSVLKDILPEVIVFEHIPLTEELRTLEEMAKLQSVPVKKRGRRLKQI